MFSTKPDKPPEGHAMRERGVRHPDDMTLRAHGFVIFSRRRGKSPVWTLGADGLEYSQEEAVQYVKNAD